MVKKEKKGKKDFTSGLDALIQNTRISERDRDLRDDHDNQDDRDDQDYQDEQDLKDGKVSKGGKAAKEKERQVTFTIPESLKKNIKKYCAANDVTIKDLFINSVTRHMKGDE